MSYQYQLASIPLEWSTTSTPSYHEQYDPTWTSSLNTMQDLYSDLDYWREVSWDQFDANMQSPLSFTSDNQSPTTDSNSMSDYSTLLAGSSTFQTSVPQLSRNSTSTSEDGEALEVDKDSRIKRRRIQNRNSQRAYRERTKLKEEQMASVISKLQEEIDMLRKREKGSTELIESMTKEVERLKRKGLVLHYQPS